MMALSTALALSLLNPMNAPQPPVTKTVDHTDTYHGITIRDPYRWLEAPISTPEVRAWADAQNAATDAYMNTIPGRDRVLNELMKRVNFERYSAPTARGDRTVYTYNSGLQNQDVIYVSDGPGKQPRILLDPNTLSQDGTVALSATDLSLDGKTFLYGVSVAGSDWIEWRARDVDTLKDKSESVKFSKFGGGVLNAEGSGLYYLRFPEPKEGQEFTAATNTASIWFHKFGTPQTQDVLIYEDKEHPDRFLYPIMDAKRTALFIYSDDPGSTNNRLYIKDLTVPDAPIIKMFDAADGNYSPIHRDGDFVWIQTSKDAPNGRIIKAPIKGRSAPVEILAEQKENLESASVVGGKLFVQYSQDAHSKVYRLNPDGSGKEEVKLPGLGAVSGWSGLPDDPTTYYSYSDFVTPATLYKYDVRSGKSEVFRELKMPFDNTKYEASQVFVTSNDGTKVPMFLVHKKGLQLTGDNPTILYGYGGFAAGQSPWFSSSRTVWMDMGGVYAVACIRGGNEYGKSWHESAIKVRRQNAYDDFIACAEWLISNKYTSNKRLMVNGGSNGGLLIGVVMNQRPDLFGVCVPEVGVMDMLRFNQFTIGKAWESDYGSPQNQDEFFSLLRISPYHNLIPGSHYPATLVLTADTDDRVVPAHSFKYAARLQASQAGPNPVYIRIESSAGHGAGTPIRKTLERVGDIYSFTLHNMGRAIPDFIGK